MVSVEFASFQLRRRVHANLLAKVPYWEALIAALDPASGHISAIGDFNTCRPYLDEAGATDPTAYYMDQID